VAKRVRLLIGHKEVAAMLGIMPSTLYEWFYTGQDVPPFYFINRRRRFDPAEVEAWKEARRG
jgi:predicted DNA-binding transcriptional regulator AlpA